MASQELLQSWARTEALLKQAMDLLSPEVKQQHAFSILQIVEFLEHNELGLAFDVLTSVAQESEWHSVALLETLALAAENMANTGASKPQQR